MRLDPDSLAQGCRALAADDPAMAALFAKNGAPPLWRRPEGFVTLLRLILEQQVSLASAAAAYRRLEDRLEDVTPEAVLALDDAELRAAAFSRQKARYARLLARALLDGSLDLGDVGRLPDADGRAALETLTGIGPWTASNYLLFALGRPDVWPPGDRALVVSMARVLDIPEPPSYSDADGVARRWRPWRSVAARLLWHDYLGGRHYDASGFS